MEYIIYFDESVNDGEYYSDFFGGVLVRNTDYDFIRCALDTMKQELNLNGEIKWIKVTANYLEKYKQIMNLFFSFIKGNRLKVRIMFRETSQTPSNLSAEQIHNRYSLLYYQFVKNAFGLIHHDSSDRTQTFLRLYFDEIPYPLDQRDSFKSHILSLQRHSRFRKAHLKIRMDDVVEIDSKKHVILQCMDVVLGSISFMLNKKNEVIPKGAVKKGHRTMAKENLFYHILRLIQESDGIDFFDISKTTPIVVPKDFWNMPYRHWKFTTPEYRSERKV